MQRDYVQYLLKTLPEMCKVKDLVLAGLYASPQAAYAARKTGLGPEFIHIPKRGILYEKSSVIQFIKSLKKKSTYKQSTCK